MFVKGVIVMEKISVSIDLIRDREISNLGKLLYINLLFLAGDNDYVNVSNNDLIKILDTNQKTFSKHKKVLIDNGYIKIEVSKKENGKFKKTKYYILKK